MGITPVCSYYRNHVGLVNIVLLPVLQNPFDSPSLVPPTLQNSVCSHSIVSLQGAVVSK